MSSSLTEFIEDHGALAYLHYYVFPIDLFMSGDEKIEAAKEQRICELTPIMCWLIPVIVILSTFTYLQGFGLALFFLLETIILTVLSVIYCWRLSLGFLLELFFNYIICIILTVLIISVAMFLWASCATIFVVGIVIAAITFFNRGDYYDDDW